MLHKRIFPPLGKRIFKTSIAVFLCMVAYELQGRHGNIGSICVTAILCMQPYVSSSKTFALERIAATLLGALWGLAFLLLMDAFPILSFWPYCTYLFMGLFVMLALYSTVLIKRPQLAAQVAIVAITTVATYPDVYSPLIQSANNLLSTIEGTIIAIFVNVFHFPRQKHPEYLFFVNASDLLPNRFRRLPSSVHIALENLYQEGAKICLVTQWAPAFLISQMGLLNVNAPIIIMDGAAIYDIRENRYLDVIPIPAENAQRLRTILAGFGVGVNLYAVNERTMTVYHDGPVNMEEKRECESMKRSPFRHYADGLPHEEDRIAFLRVIDTTENISNLSYQLKSVLPSGMFRMEIRPDERFDNTAGLYFYNPKAAVKVMKERVRQIVELESRQYLIPVEMKPRKSKNLPEHDALLLLGRLRSKFAPVRLLPGKKNRKQEEQTHV